MKGPWKAAGQGERSGSGPAAGGWRERLSGWARSAVEWLYPRPPLCLLCQDGWITSLSEPLCPQCLEEMPRFHSPLCERCGIPVDFPDGGEIGAYPPLTRRVRRFLAGWTRQVLCPRCRQDPPGFVGARAVMPYQGWARSAVHRLKYRGEAELAVPLGGLMGLLAREELLFLSVSAVVPVPLHPDRLQERGYNQSELLAAEVAAAIGRPLRSDLLIRRRPTASQVGLTERERRLNLQGAFAVTDPKGVEGRRILLVDDVLTTGATCREASRTLLEAGSRSVLALTLAVTPWPGGDPAGSPEIYRTRPRVRSSGGGMGMSLRNCARCGRLTDGRFGSLCPECKREDAEAFEKVEKYLRQHPDANLMQVSEGTGVDADHIRRFLRDGRLEIVGDPDALHCERCGASITTGRLCSDCVRELERSASAQPAPEVPEPEKPKETPARFHLGRRWLEERRERYRQ